MTDNNKQIVRIDIDARRREADDIPIVVIIGGEEFKIHRGHIGLLMLKAGTAEDLPTLMRIILGDDRIGDTIDLSLDEVKFIMDTLNTELGFDQPGGALGLAAYLAEHHDAVEADLHRHFCVDLLDLYRGRLSLRKIGVLLHALPADSATAVAEHGDAALWTLLNYQLADLVDAAALTCWAVVAANAKRTPRVPPRYPRPKRRGASAPTADSPHISTSDEVRAFFGPTSITYTGQK